MIARAAGTVSGLLLAVPRAVLAPLREDIQGISREMEVLQGLRDELATIRAHVERLDDEVLGMHRDVQGIHGDVVEMRSSLILVGATVDRVGGILPRGRRRRRGEALEAGPAEEPAP